MTKFDKPDLPEGSGPFENDSTPARHENAPSSKPDFGREGDATRGIEPSKCSAEGKRHAKKTVFPAEGCIRSKFAYSIREVVERTGLSRSQVYKEIAAKRLGAKKVGARTVILHRDLLRYLCRLPDFDGRGGPPRRRR
jgi:excisionase family DNA binding protein